MSLFATPAAAQPRRGQAVLVLEVKNESDWEQGVQALMAELLTTGYELNVRVTHAPSLEQLERELQVQVADSEALAGVSVTRQGDDATALLCRRGASPCERLAMKVSEGELSRSRLAVAVVERLRPIDLPTAPAPEPPRPRATPAPPPPKPPPPPVDRASPFRTWLSGGVVLYSGMSAPLGWLTASLALRRAMPWGLELCFSGSPVAGKAETAAGSLALLGLQAAAFATFEPLSRRPFGFGLGLGGGVLHLQETATPAAGFEVSSHRVTVGVMSARARLFHRLGPTYLGLTIEPGILVPAVSVETGSETALRIGRPWVSMQASLGIDL